MIHWYLPNVWDVASARAVAEAGFPVIATASNAISAALGYDDGEGTPSDEMLYVAQRIVASVDVPVTVDAEAGYGMPADELVDLLIDIGAVGCNIEDTDHANGGLFDVDVRATYHHPVACSCRWHRRTPSNQRPNRLLLPHLSLADDQKLADAISQRPAYRTAGADCVFPPGAAPDDLRAIISKTSAPVNAGFALESGSLDELRAIGVARVSVGPQLYRNALEHLRTDLQPLSKTRR